MIVVADYGMGNLRSVQKAFEFLGHRAVVTEDPGAVAEASHLVLPGDAAFGDAMQNIRRLGWDEAVHAHVGEGKPFLGICVGLQLMFDESEERGRHQGLGLLPGRVVRFPPAERVPQIGWNQIAIQRRVKIVEDIPEGSFFYFVHSFYVAHSHDEDCVATTEYGLHYTSIAGRDNVVGVQFHPEKSQQVGLRILQNFASMN